MDRYNLSTQEGDCLSHELARLLETLMIRAETQRSPSPVKGGGKGYFWLDTNKLYALSELRMETILGSQQQP